MGGYRLSVERPVAAGVRLIAQKQLARAEHELTAASRRFNEGRVHTARKRLKKVRALLRLVRPSLGKTYRREVKPLRRIGHRLGPISDSGAAVSVVTLLRKRYRGLVPQSTALAVRRSLVRRERIAAGLAGGRQTLVRAAHALHAERRRAAHWTLHGQGFAAVGGGLERTFRAGRRAMQRASDRPTVERLHAWRRRAKDLWLQLRLVEGHCRPGLSADRRALEALDAVLGECHDLALLTDAVERDTALSRDEGASLVRAARRERRRLLTRSQALGRRIYRDKPKAFARRVARLWKAS